MTNAAAAKSLQLCLTLCDPIHGSPPGSSIPGILQTGTLEWVAISFSNARKWKVKVKSLSPVQLLATPWAAAYQAPPSMGFSRQEYWSGVPLPSPSWPIDVDKMETVTDFIFLGSNITVDNDYSHEIKWFLLLGRKTMANLDSILKNRDITLPTKVHTVKAVVFSSSHVQMWELDHKECWAPKNWCFWTVVLKKTLVSPFYCKVIKPVSLKGNQPWMFIGRAESETPILCPHDSKSLLIRKNPDAGKDWRQEKKETTEDEMLVWNHWFNGHEFKQTPGDSEG